MPRLRMNQAIALALADEMRHDPTVVTFGEDVAAAGGVFKTSQGLLDEFGPKRVRDTPISEMAIVGAAVGAAVAGLRPVAEIMFVDFMGVALDQLVTQGALAHYLSNGSVTVPMVVRSSIGVGRGFSATHSRTAEPWFLSSAGLKLVVSSRPSSAYGLLRAAIRDESPVIVLEPRSLYGSREEFDPGEDAIIPLGRAAELRSGSDVTVVALGQTVGIALQVAEALADRMSVQVLDLQTLRPWDREAVLASVASTRRLAIVEESPFTGGWGTEIAAHVSEELFGDLAAPILRVTAPDVPIPFNKTLEFMYLPSVEYTTAQIEHWADDGKIPDPWWANIDVEEVG